MADDGKVSFSTMSHLQTARLSSYPDDDDYDEDDDDKSKCQLTC